MTDHTTSDGQEPSQARIDQVEEQIDRARHAASDVLAHTDAAYDDSGDAASRRLDDQTITPPG